MTKTKNQKQIIDISLIILLPFAATGLSILFNANYLATTLLFFGLPAIYLSHRNKKAVKKTLIFASINGIALTVLIDYMAIINNAWYLPKTIFPFRFLGVIPLEDFLWGFGLIYLIVIFYEHFFDKTGKELIGKRMGHSAVVLFFALVVFLIALVSSPALLEFSYAYLWLGLLFILLPTIIFAFISYDLLARFLKASTYFFFLLLLLELTGLYLGLWTFPGPDFVGWVDFFGYKFPIEELFFFITITSIATLSCYEFFDDDGK